jgi:hypothetical protein
MWGARVEPFRAPHRASSVTRACNCGCFSLRSWSSTENRDGSCASTRLRRRGYSARISSALCGREDPSPDSARNTRGWHEPLWQRRGQPRPVRVDAGQERPGRGARRPECFGTSLSVRFFRQRENETAALRSAIEEWLPERGEAEQPAWSTLVLPGAASAPVVAISRDPRSGPRLAPVFFRRRR